MRIDHITDFDLQALADNDLEGDKLERVLKAIAKDPDLENRLYDLRRQRALLRLWWTQDEKI